MIPPTLPSCEDCIRHWTSPHLAYAFYNAVLSPRWALGTCNSGGRGAVASSAVLDSDTVTQTTASSAPVKPSGISVLDAMAD